MKPAIALEEALAAIEADCNNSRRIVVGFSGGLDSTVLLHQAARAFPGRVSALHGHHGLHGDADRWAEHCRAICVALHVPFKSQRLEIIEDGHGPEAAARDARYRWFAEQLQSDDVLLLAHHLDDQVETLLLRLLRGAGPDGLGAMPERRAIGDAWLLRPFLHLPRAVLGAFATEEKLHWIEDPSNASSRFDRNYLRHEVLPLIAERWPGYRKTLGRAASQLRAISEARVPPPMPAIRNVVGEPGFSLQDLPASAPSASLAIRHWLKALDLPMPPSSRLAEFQRQLTEGQGASLATSRYQLTRYRDAVYCRSPDEPAPPSLRALRVGEQHSSPELGCLRILAEQPDLIPATLSVRFRRPGDRMAGSDGHLRELKELFQQQGIPPWWRGRVPLICGPEEGQERILALGTFYRSPLAERAGLTVEWTPNSGLID